MVSSSSRAAVIERRSAYQPGSAQEYFMVRGLRDAINTALAEFVQPLGTNGRVLDFGCGEQPLRAALEGMGLQYTAADVQQNCAGSVDCVLVVDEALPPPLVGRGPFDVVLCTEVLEHVADWDWAFRSVVSVLAPGGIVLVTCPHVYPLHEKPHDYWRPTSFALRYFGRRYGLSILDERTLGDGFDVLGTVLACVRPESKSRSMFGRLAAGACNVARKAAFVLVRSQGLRALVAGRSDLYLSNLVVFKGPDAPLGWQHISTEKP
jgi:SAM-dependent methyltransferase